MVCCEPGGGSTVVVTFRKRPDVLESLLIEAFGLFENLRRIAATKAGDGVELAVCLGGEITVEASHGHNRKISGFPGRPCDRLRGKPGREICHNVVGRGYRANIAQCLRSILAEDNLMGEIERPQRLYPGQSQYSP